MNKTIELWAVHIVLPLKSAELLPLGIGLGLHRVVYSWIVGHRVGLLHAVLQTILVTLRRGCRFQNIECLPSPFPSSRFMRFRFIKCPLERCERRFKPAVK